MKKTLVAVIVSAFAAAAANAAVVYENEGTKVEASGSVRVLLEKSNQEKDTAGKNTHSSLKNDGSRFELGVIQNLNQDGSFYALSKVRIDFNGQGQKEDKFGDLKVRRAYAGLGLKHSDSAKSQFTIGRQDTILDDIGLAEDYSYGLLTKDLLGKTTNLDVARYDYFLNTDTQNLQFSTGYVFGENRDNTNNLANNALENAFSIGAVYDVQVGPGSILVDTGFGRTNFKSATNEKSYKNGFGFSVGYDLDGYVVSLDTAIYKAKNIGSATVADVVYGGDSKGFYVSPGFQAPIIKVDGKTVSRAYGNYLFEQHKTINTQTEEKTKKHGFLLGVDYKLHKNVVTYVEGKYVVSKTYTNGVYDQDSKAHDKAIGVGLRVFF